jgi:hypothetical protein
MTPRRRFASRGNHHAGGGLDWMSMVGKSEITDGAAPEAERALPERLPELDPRVGHVEMTTGFFRVPLAESLLAGIESAQQRFVRHRDRRSQRHAVAQAGTRPGARTGS